MSDAEAVLRSIRDHLAGLDSAYSLQAQEPSEEEMSSRGSVKTFHPVWTTKRPDGSREKHTATTWAWRFYFRNRCYQGADGYTTSAEAREAGERRKAELRAGMEEDWRRLRLSRLHDMAKARTVEWDPGTVKNFGPTWKRLFSFLSPDDVVATIDDVRLYQLVADLREQGYAASTIRNDLKSLHAAMMIAHRKRLLPWLPEFPKVKALPRENTITPDQLHQIVQAMPAQYHLLFEAGEIMAWRVWSELRSRQWAHVDFGPETWACCGRIVSDDVCACGAGRPGWVELDAASSKTDARRQFPMTRALRSVLERARLRCQALQAKLGRVIPWVFPAEDGGPLPSYKNEWTRARKKAGVDRIPGKTGPWSAAAVPHDIRRSAIRRMARQGVERGARKALVGHMSDAVHSAYEGRGGDAEALREAAVRLDQAGPVVTNVVQLALFRGR